MGDTINSHYDYHNFLTEIVRFHHAPLSDADGWTAMSLQRGTGDTRRNVTSPKIFTTIADGPTIIIVIPFLPAPWFAYISPPMKASYETDFLARQWAVEFNYPQIMALGASTGSYLP